MYLGLCGTIDLTGADQRFLNRKLLISHLDFNPNVRLLGNCVTDYKNNNAEKYK